ncbi:MAG: hypothetical protein EU532_11265 [Promethearchaeota archaeon]|nr:MAG: hypothetical protein EU532_11265 [Candidatus Lokiarchaeota archaeon]
MRNLTTKKKILLTSTILLFIGIFLISSFPILATPVATTNPSESDSELDSELIVAFASDGSNTMSPDNLLPGDIILLGTDDTFFDYLIPGKWSHTVIVGGVAGYHEIWATEEGTWVPEGETWVVHSTKDDTDSGLRTSRYNTVVNHHAGNVVAIRILKPGGALMSASERAAIVNFATSKIGLDEGYDWNWLGKQIDIDTADPEIAPDGYYCSELAWAAYKSVLGIELDGDFSPFNIGVSPEDIYWSQYAQVIALEMNSDPNGNSVPGGAYKIDASNDLYKLTVFVDEVYYDDEHEGWLMGDGEMYLKLWIGEGYFPSCAANGYKNDNHLDKIDDAGDHYTSAGSREAIDWNNYHYALVSFNSYLKIRIQASEYDSTSGDDDYPVFQWFWDGSTWHNYIDNGWYWSGSRVDLGDCRYTIYFKIETVY